MPTSESRAELSVRNDFSDLVTVTEAVDRLGAEVGFPAKALMQLQVALDEILCNVIKYAWADAESHQFSVRVVARESAIEVAIADDGQPFDPRAQPPPGPAGGRRPRPGGVGIHMVRQLVDGFDYARVGALNTLTLTKRRTRDD